MRCTSPEIAAATFIPLPFILVTTGYRLWIRRQRRAWGIDDWAMLINLVSQTAVVRFSLAGQEFEITEFPVFDSGKLLDSSSTYG